MLLVTVHCINDLLFHLLFHIKYLAVLVFSFLILPVENVMV